MKNVITYFLFLLCVSTLSAPLFAKGKVDFAVQSIGSAILSGGAVYLSLKYDNSLFTTLFIWLILTKAAMQCITEDEPDMEEKGKQALFIGTFNGVAGFIGANFSEEKT